MGARKTVWYWWYWWGSCHISTVPRNQHPYNGPVATEIDYPEKQQRWGGNVEKTTEFCYSRACVVNQKLISVVTACAS